MNRKYFNGKTGGRHYHATVDLTREETVTNEYYVDVIIFDFEGNPTDSFSRNVWGRKSLNAQRAVRKAFNTAKQEGFL